MARAHHAHPELDHAHPELQDASEVKQLQSDVHEKLFQFHRQVKVFIICTPSLSQQECQQASTSLSWMILLRAGLSLSWGCCTPTACLEECIGHHAMLWHSIENHTLLLHRLLPLAINSIYEVTFSRETYSAQINANAAHADNYSH